MDDKNTGKLTEYILKRRRQRDDELKYDFMPSLMEIVERPSHVAGRVIIVTMALLLVFAICYACASRLDVVVMGQGNVTGTSKMLNINSMYGGSIAMLNVEEGDEVHAGEVLITLDTQGLMLNKALMEHELDRAKLEKEILGMYAEDENAVIDVSRYDAKHAQFIESLMLDNELYKRQTESAYDKELVKLQRDLEVARRISELEELMVQCDNNIAGIDRQLEGMTIASSVDGYVSELNVSGTGESIVANSTLMTIIPDDNEFIFEGYILDKDIGSVSVNDKVQIKLSAYSYSDYGAVYGKIVEISKDSRYIEGLGNVYAVKAVFDEDMNTGIVLEYGMSGSMEVIVGRRSLMDYFLEPVMKGLDNSLKEK